MPYNHLRALELLRLGCGRADAQFRDGQEEAIRHVVEGAGRLLVVQKTGWGKSFVYFIAVKMLREQGAGPAILVSPLLALMRNQIAAALRMNVRAASIHSENEDDWPQLETDFLRDRTDILLVSPERLANEHFRTEMLAPIAGRVSLLVVDEAHCISDWGHDFRPEYRLLERMVRTLPPNSRFLATTATANNRVIGDLTRTLGPNLQVQRGDLNRDSLSLQTIRLPGQAERLAWLAEQIPKLPGSGIVYVLTKRDASQVAGWLISRGVNAAAYTGQTGDDREPLEQALLHNRIKVLIATTALGMGFDKPDLSFVIHYQTPGSVVAYYQQVGRAGRALASAYGILLSGEEETDITDYFIETAFPKPAEVERILLLLEDAPLGLSVNEIQREVNISYGRILKTVDLLSLESPAPVVKQKSKWVLTAAVLADSFWERAARLTELRRAEQQQMQEYARLPRGAHMPFLLEALNGDARLVRPPVLPPLPDTASPAMIQQAVAFLKRAWLPIEPRIRWPSGGLVQYDVKGNIPADMQASAGRVLSLWGDAGWGSEVKQGKYQSSRFSGALVSACVEMVYAWDPRPDLRWVTCVPSLRHSQLVPDFARRLADGLRLPFHESLIKTAERPEQKTMANGIQQARNLDGSIAFAGGAVPPGGVLLVDDMFNSRWTLTIAAWLLRTNGSGEVFPLALAQTGPGR